MTEHPREKELEGLLNEFLEHNRQAAAAHMALEDTQNDLDAAERTRQAMLSIYADSYMRQAHLSACLKVSEDAAKVDRAKGKQYQADSKKLRKALRKLENACDTIAGLRSPSQYNDMIDSGQQGALEELDDARRSARTILETPPR